MTDREILNCSSTARWGRRDERLGVRGERGDFSDGDSLLTELEDRLVRDNRSASGGLNELMRTQAQLGDCLAVGQHQLLQNFMRLQNVVIEANRASRALVHQQLQKLGLCMPYADTSTAAIGTEPSFLDLLRHHWQGATNARQACEVTDILTKYVEGEALRCERMRNEVSERLELTFARYGQWIDFFRVALEVAQSHQRDEIEQGIRLIEARQKEATANWGIYREVVRLEGEVEEAAHRRGLENRGAEVSNYVQLRRLKAETDVMAQEIALKERTEQHTFDIDRQKMELQRRRNDQDFISSVIGQGIQAAKIAMR